MRKLFLVGLLIFPMLAHSESKPLPIEKIKKFQRCKSDSDCIYVTNGCCDCANGGGDAAVNKKMKKAFQSQFDCETAICTQMAAIPGCGTGKVTCQAELCKYEPAK